MLLTFVMLFATPARALQFDPHYSLVLACMGEAHQITLAGDFARSAFIESAVVDGVEEGPDLRRSVDGGVETISKPGVFSLPIPAENPSLRQFVTEVDVRGDRAPMTCQLTWNFHLFKR